MCDPVLHTTLFTLKLDLHRLLIISYSLLSWQCHTKDKTMLYELMWSSNSKHTRHNNSDPVWAGSVYFVQCDLNIPSQWCSLVIKQSHVAPHSAMPVSKNSRPLRKSRFLALNFHFTLIRFNFQWYCFIHEIDYLNFIIVYLLFVFCFQGINKRDLLKQILPIIGANLRWQRLYTEYQEQLDSVS